ncbi:hypothetical protein [Streptomyces sp. NPDC058304]|uniref:hypothetical protein n=1 Tax=Streptomyces sp. NPDC058304 TaxID=3346437 RepID=UPI0036EB112D
MGSLEPISDGGTEEARALATALRTIFEALDISVRRYAARCHTDPGTVSRYLNGTRLPSWSFIKELLANVAEHRDQQASDEAVALLRRLHASALAVGNGTKRVQELQNLLAEADEQVREAASLERVLRQALREQQHQVAQLDVEIQSLRAARSADRQATSNEIELYYSNADELRAERDQLRLEVDLLKRQLKDATSARILAEQRCDKLERQIEEAELQETEAQEYAPALREESTHAAAEYRNAERRIEQLQSELADARSRAAEIAETAAKTARHADTHAKPASSDTLASRLGYSPEQVLRRVYSANRLDPSKIEEIFRQSLTIQTPPEIDATENLIRSMPSYIVYMHRELREKSNRLKASNYRAGPLFESHEDEQDLAD